MNEQMNVIQRVASDFFLSNAGHVKPADLVNAVLPHTQRARDSLTASKIVWHLKQAPLNYDVRPQKIGREVVAYTILLTPTGRVKRSKRWAAPAGVVPPAKPTTTKRVPDDVHIKAATAHPTRTAAVAQDRADMRGVVTKPGVIVFDDRTKKQKELDEKFKRPMTPPPRRARLRSWRQFGGTVYAN